MAKSAIQIGSGYLAHPGRQQPVSTSVLTTVLLHPARIAPVLEDVSALASPACVL